MKAVRPEVKRRRRCIAGGRMLSVVHVAWVSESCEAVYAGD
jgi:hypothetical protein